MGEMMETSKNEVYMMNCITKKSSRLLIHLTDVRLGHLGLKHYHTIVMAVIGFDPGSSQKHIMENTPFTKARVSIIVSELIEMGYVVDTSEGKSSSLVLTKEGERVFRIAEGIFLDHHRELLEILSKEEAAIFHDIIVKMNGCLDEMLSKESL